MDINTGNADGSLRWKIASLASDTQLKFSPSKLTVADAN